MLKYRCREKQSSIFQVPEHQRIRLLTEGSRPQSLFCHLTFCIYKLYERKVIVSSHLGVILTKGRRDVNYARTVRQCNVGVT